MTGPAPANPASGVSRVDWFLAALALTGFALAAFMQVRTGSVGWTTWALPVLIICNLAVRRLAATRPERARMWSRLGTLITLTMLAVIVTATFLR